VSLPHGLEGESDISNPRNERTPRHVLR
jgi:hypothetical protein